MTHEPRNAKDLTGFGAKHFRVDIDMFLPVTHEPRNAKDLTSSGSKHFRVAPGGFRRAKLAVVATTTITVDEDPKLMKAITRTRDVYQAHLVKKRARSIKMIDIHELPESVKSVAATGTRAAIEKCQAVTLTGKPCPFRKISGTDHCKKHKVMGDGDAAMAMANL